MQPDEQEVNYWNPEETGADNMYAPETTDEATAEQPSDQPDEITKKDDSAPVHWSANEYVHQEKNGLWFILFGLFVLGLIALDLFILKSFTFSALVIVMAVALIIYIRRPPKAIDYTLSGDQGLYIGEKLYHFSEFKSFGLINDDGQHSIMLIPTKRFAPGVSVYFPEDAGEKIVDILGTRLPMEQLKLDYFDIIVRKLRL
ncbi:hypothetical protein HGB25_00640 [Candidatus Saccharibacteria bacterium]|nr:hypothetical protein [Candidatus Saccharibacteria bacterium]